MGIGSSNADGSCTIGSSDSILSTALNPYVVGILLLWVAWSIRTLWKSWHLGYNLQLWYEYLWIPIPMLDLSDLPRSVTEDDGVDEAPFMSTPSSSAAPPPSLHNPQRPGMIQCYDPASGQRLGEVPAMTPVDVDRVCRAAAAAQKEWRTTTFAQRRAVLRTLQRYIATHAAEICRVSARDSGKPIVDAYLGEILTTTEKIRTLIAEGELWLRPDYDRPTGPVMLYKVPRVEYEPLGVIAPIAPWNYPFHNFMNHILSGLFAGNAVVGKVSEHTSWSAVVYYRHIVHAALTVHGHAPDLVGLVTGFGDAGNALVTHPCVDKIVFTGSPGIGQKVMAAAAAVLKPVILELGGKDAMVVTEDVSIAQVLPFVMRGCYQNGGQNCVGVERVLVYESIYPAFIAAVLPKVQALRQGNPLAAACPVDCGAMVMDAQLSLIQELIDDAVQQGAKVLVGGKRNATIPTGGQFYEPTIVVDVTPDMRIFQEEVFGPVMTIVKVEHDRDATCVELVNHSAFGLSASVFCRNAVRALHLARQIRSGMVCTNDFNSNYLIQSLPFGGVKESGFGRFAGPEGLRALCLERAVVTDRFPGLVQTSIPAAIDFPIDPDRGVPFVHALIQFFYNDSLIEKVKAIVGLIKYG
jgi:acyl-CoA reductase-like NAD-dependent aldehyde dehydrogenase